MSRKCLIFDTFGVDFDTMGDIQRVKYLKIDKGRFNYQRRVPKNLQPLFVETTWVRPCGDVTYAKAIQKVVTWAEEDDALIERMKDPVEFQKFKTEARRKLDEIDRNFCRFLVRTVK